MKLNKKARIIGLSVILIALIAAGIGIFALLSSGQNNKPGLDAKSTDIKDTQAEQLRYIQAG